MKRNSSLDDKMKLNKQRQLEENRRSTKNAITTFTHTTCMDISLDEDKQVMNEPVAMLELQKVSNLYDALTAESINKLTVSVLYSEAFSKEKSVRTIYTINNIHYTTFWKALNTRCILIQNNN